MAEASHDEASSLRSSRSHANPFVKLVRSTLGYRKTSLTLLILVTFVVTFLTSHYDNSLEATVPLPTDELEQRSLDYAWLGLQNIGRLEHPYGSPSNDQLHDYLESQIKSLIAHKDYIEYDNDLNYTNNILYQSSSGRANVVSYYESNNLVVRINGTNPKLPALLLSSHYDSVPSSFGITDDGMGVASMLGLLFFYSQKATEQPTRTLVLNFNNDEEFGLYGATTFLNHPFIKNIDYFLNLEGTGAGGKAFLFRGTDYGIVNHFKNVRHPYGNSIFQQGFGNGLIHSETDYKIYKEDGGLRGLDVAFYKPRDIYHTTRDDIRHTSVYSLWHMLSIALDFTAGLQNEIDLDSEQAEDASDFALFFSFLDHFFAYSTSRIVLVNTILLVLVPLTSIPFLVVIFQYKHNWNLSFVNVLKFPVSFVLSILALDIFVDATVVTQNQFIANSSFLLVVYTSLAVFFLLNYVILNSINLVFKGYNVINHDEKLIVNIEISLLTWLALIYSTYKLSSNRIGDDHTGELPITILFVLQSLGSLLGLIGWSFKEGKKEENTDDESSQPLLDNQRSYGTQEDDHNDLDGSIDDDAASSLSFEHPELETKFRSYDWLLQFLLIVPLSSLIIYNWGFLILDGLNKSIQESLQSERLIYQFAQLFVIIWSIPFLPFIFKFNRIIVTLLLIVSFAGSILIQHTAPFDINNPLKLRFIQSIDLNRSTDSYVRVSGRINSPLETVLQDIPSVKESGTEVKCTPLGDGMQECVYKSSLPPSFASGNQKLTKDLIDIEIVKNSTANNDYPFGLLSGEIKIKVPKNRMCNLKFNISESTGKLIRSINGDTPVKTFIWYNDKKQGNQTDEAVHALATPEGFSVDKEGNYVYKLLDGIDAILLNKLDWDKDYHLGFQWIPDLVDTDSIDINSVLIHKLGIQTECFWADVNPFSYHGEARSPVPAFEEVVHYSPVHISWANRDRGLVSASKYIEI